MIQEKAHLVNELTPKSWTDFLGFFMSKYSPEFKEKLAREYHESNIGITTLANQHGLSESMLHAWYKRYQVHGAKAFEKKYGTYSAQFKLSVLGHMKKHHLSYRETAAYFDLRGGHGVVSKWQRLYDEGGIKALEPRPKGRPAKMKKPLKPPAKDLTPAEQELKKLHEELAYLRAENAYLKKLDDLLRQKEQSLKSTSKRKKK